jgi:hypothetical protein
MVEAAVHQELIRRYAGGSVARDGDQLLVDVEVQPPLAGGCESATFTLYREGQPVNADLMLVLAFAPVEHDTWVVTPSLDDPPNSPDDRDREGGFDDVMCYCGLLGAVKVTRTKGGWFAWYDPGD